MHESFRRVQEVKMLACAVLIVSCAAASAAPAEPRADSFYQAILKKKGLEEKRDLGRRLGRLRTPEAKELLLKLLGERSYWDQLAAVDGLLLFEDGPVYARLVQELLRNHMVEDQVSQGLRRHGAAAFPALAEAYRSPIDKDGRAKVLAAMAGARAPAGEKFLKEIVADAESEDRGQAMRLIILDYPANDSFIRKLSADPALRPQVLDYICKNGSAGDLPRFTDILARSRDAVELVIAYRAVRRWGDSPLQKDVYRSSLRAGDESLVRGGLRVFKEVRSDELRGELSRVVRQASSQDTRMLAGERLADYSESDVVPYLVPLLQEEYSVTQPSLSRAIAGVLSAGISDALDSYNEHFNRKVFDGQRESILGGLRRIARTDNGTSYDRWLDWAVADGYTVKGRNLIQDLFSGYPEKRGRAVVSAVKLLGYRDLDEFSRKNGSASGSELSLRLARMLTDKGYPKDEKF
ncbi:MAG: hypothetical protein NTY77_18985 [Elusimicrobia bacterium]|nr:hypothetical protein [Elusimicrobiota bacterium]